MNIETPANFAPTGSRCVLEIANLIAYCIAYAGVREFFNRLGRLWDSKMLCHEGAV